MPCTECDLGVQQQQQRQMLQGHLQALDGMLAFRRARDACPAAVARGQVPASQWPALGTDDSPAIYQSCRNCNDIKYDFSI